ncbi:MAG: low-complexity tail membrane protein [Phormidesmis sp. RL_2_1]|nr:low-complexity tail membrane protein [Phormidesmis sp. RL_2_1]
MVELQQERYLWVHLVGLAAVPLLLALCLAGLASAGPAFDYPAAFGLQFWAIALFGIIPSLWMQIARPFYPFSLPPVALKPDVLSEDQRRCLTILKSWQVKALAGITAGLALWLLAQLYQRSPQITPIMTPTAGLINAAVAFFLSCLFLQISVSAVRSLLVGPNVLQRVPPYEASAIAADFLIVGLRVPAILPMPTSPVPASSGEEPATAAKPTVPQPTVSQPTVSQPTVPQDDIPLTPSAEAAKDTEVSRSEVSGSEAPALKEPMPEEPDLTT